MSSLYQSAHEPSDTSLELKKKQHSIWGMNTLRKWAFDRQQRFVNRVCLCRQHCLHFFLVQDRLLTLAISLRSIPGDTMSHRGKAERLWNSRLSDLLWAFVLNLSQDVPSNSQIPSNGTALHTAAGPKGSTHQAPLPGKSHSQRKRNFSFSVLKSYPIFFLIHQNLVT